MRRAGLAIGLLAAAGLCVAAVRTPDSSPRSTPQTSTGSSWGDKYLLNNQLYSAGKLPAVPCQLPDEPLKARSDVQKSADAILVCLERAWKPVVERAGRSFSPTTVYVMASGMQTGCGDFDGDADGFYCPINSDIYIDWTQHVEDKPADRRYVSAYLLYVMAHEYGHHVQQLTGIMPYYEERLDRTAGEASAEQTRRLELQASCLAAAFLGANQDTLDLHDDRLEAYEDGAYFGDSEHGSDKDNTYWSDAAFAAKSPSACNTWAAAAKRVS